MPILASEPRECKPLPQMNSYEVYCEDCTFNRYFEPETIGTVAHEEAVERSFAIRQSHANAQPGHRVHSRMHSQNIYTGMDLVRLRTGEE